MSNSQKSFLKSKMLDEFITSLQKAESTEGRDKVWNDIETPFIEDISDNPNDKLVTFLYRFDEDHLLQSSIYLYSSVTGFFLSESSRLRSIPKTDALYLSLVLPCTLRTAYNFLKIDESISTEIKDDHQTINSDFPMPIGEFKKSQILLGKLFEHNKIEIDPRNRNKFVYYVDYEKLDQFFGMESWLELPMAPKQPYLPSSMELVREERDKLKKAERFFEYSIQFTDTSLKNSSEYANQSRKYWVYLPPNYDAKNSYPLLFFLDGSDFINPIPCPSILEKMILDGVISPSIAVFFDYSMERRQQEYYCDNEFTKFIAHDFISILRNKNHLSITNDPKYKTIIGLSASGLAAFYAGLIYPTIFGNVITYSASFESKKKADIETLINQNHLALDSRFYLEAGIYETIPVELQFSDSSTQSLSILEANKNIFEFMNKNAFNVNFYEFCGGHNYICWRNLLPNRLKEVYENRLEKINENKMK